MLPIPALVVSGMLLVGSAMDKITESGKPLAKARSVKFLRMEGDGAVLVVESGTYGFKSQL